MCYFFYVISNTYVILIFLISCLFCKESFAQEEEQESTVEELGEKPKTVAIQNRPYILNKEFGFYYSYMPLDHFNHFHSFGMNYLNYYNDYLAWEVFNAAKLQSENPVIICSPSTIYIFYVEKEIITGKNQPYPNCRLSV